METNGPAKRETRYIWMASSSLFVWTKISCASVGKLEGCVRSHVQAWARGINKHNTRRTPTITHSKVFSWRITAGDPGHLGCMQDTARRSSGVSVRIGV